MYYGSRKFVHFPSSPYSGMTRSLLPAPTFIPNSGAPSSLATIHSIQTVLKTDLMTLDFYTMALSPLPLGYQLTSHAHYPALPHPTLRHHSQPPSSSSPRHLALLPTQRHRVSGQQQPQRHQHRHGHHAAIPLEIEQRLFRGMEDMEGRRVNWSGSARYGREP